MNFELIKNRMRMKPLLFVSIFFANLGLLLVRGSNANRTNAWMEPALLDFMFANYNPYSRPVLNAQDSIVVKVGIMLRQIINVDEKNQIMTSNVWLRLYWTDQLINWEPSRFGGLTSINVEADRLWRPDIVLWNPSSTNLRIGSLYNKLDTLAIVRHTGTVAWLSPVILKTDCQMDVTYFPFDQQNCLIQFGSWTHNIGKIDTHLLINTVDLSEYIANKEFQLLKAPGKRILKNYTCCLDTPYTSVLFTLVLKRKAMFYAINLIFPCILLTLLSIFSFFLPANSGERVSFEITVLLSMSVYMLIVTDNIPQSSTVPLISKFFMAEMIQIALSLAATCVVIKYSSSKKPMGPKLKKYINHHLAHALRMKPKKCKVSRSANSVTNDSAAVITNNRSSGEEFEKSVRRKNNSEKLQVNQIVKELKTLTSKVFEEEAATKLAEDWEFAGEVLDRFFMVTFFLTIIITCAAVFSVPSGA